MRTVRGRPLLVGLMRLDSSILHATEVAKRSWRATAQKITVSTPTVTRTRSFLPDWIRASSSAPSNYARASFRPAHLCGGLLTTQALRARRCDQYGYFRIVTTHTLRVRASFWPGARSRSVCIPNRNRRELKENERRLPNGIVYWLEQAAPKPRLLEGALRIPISLHRLRSGIP